MEEITFNSHIPHDGQNQYVFVRSDAHETCWGTFETCSVSKCEAQTLESAVDKFTAKVYDDCSLNCRHDPTWQHMALLANDAKHAQEMTETLKEKGYVVIEDIDVLWPQCHLKLHI
ncbi:hypothetical protein GCM10011332_33640 [Terasakiella brassicae]|uniref:Uncharacterized protein n=1 Tax=Terasakiella brassicae TaxID=1634917 RepID=A0A917C8V1_9PROT|nr:hypothetical protein [Terasakiella brassicae]GGF76945.1 hypothetical protein GCM10011332_33640 [Terasakiella brassicae]